MYLLFNWSLLVHILNGQHLRVLALQLRLCALGLQGRGPVRQVLHHHLGALRLPGATLPADQDGLLLFIDHHGIEGLHVSTRPASFTTLWERASLGAMQAPVQV